MTTMGKTIEEISQQHNITKGPTSREESDIFWQDIGILKNKRIISQKQAANVLAVGEIANIIQESYGPADYAENEKQWKEKVASDSQLANDVEETIKADRLYLVNSPFSKYSSVRATPRHAQSGHATFGGYGRKKEKFPNTEMDDVLKAIEGKRIDGIEDITMRGFKNESQQLIDDIAYCVEDYFKSIIKNPSKQIPNPSRRLLTREGKPIAGLEFLKNQDIDMLEFMRGFYFASLMDNHEDIRANVKQIYGHRSGGGEGYIMNKQEIMKYGINLDHLAKKRHSGLLGIINDMEYGRGIEVLTKIGVISGDAGAKGTIDPTKYNWDALKSERATDLQKNPNLTNQYVRHERGRGCGDDIAVFLASFLPNTYSKQERKNSEISRFIGALLADNIDTVEKDARFAFPGGQDEFSGEYFNKLFKTSARTSKNFRDKFEIKKRKDEQYNLLPKRVIVDYMAASANIPDETVHSSQRHFFKEVNGTCAISQYVKQVFTILRKDGKETPSDTELRRMYRVNMEGRIPLVNLTFQQIPAKDVIQTMMKRYELIREPEKREGKIREFYSRQD